MGEAKRRRRLDPTWGKSRPISYKEERQIFQVKHTVPNLDKKLTQILESELLKLSESQQDELVELAEDFNKAVSDAEHIDAWLESRKQKTDSVVFELFWAHFLAVSHLLT